MKGYAMLRVGEAGWVNKNKPVPGPYDAILEPVILAPCTSDVHTVYHGAAGARFNVILGHEAIGKIVEVGSEVKDFMPGDTVIVPAITPNWRSVDLQLGTPPQHSGGMNAGLEFTKSKDGVFAEYFHVNDVDMNVALLPQDITPEQGIMMSDMMTTGLHGAELADIQLGATVAVIGIGPVGLMAIAGAKLCGAGRIFAVGSREKCVLLAKEYGATDTINYKDGDIVQQILEANGHKGVDHVILAGGSSKVLRQAISMLKPGGKLANVNYFDDADDLPLPRKEWGYGMSHKQINGGLCPGGRGRMERMIALVRHKRLDPGLLVSHRLSGLESIEQALSMMRDKSADVIKPIVVI